MTKTEEKNVTTNEKCIPKKMYSEKKNMQNSILKQTKVAKQGTDYMEQASQEKNGILFGGQL